MAKGRKLGINRNERFLGSYSNNGHAQGSYNGDDSSELREEDVWSIIDNKNSADGEDENYGNITVRTRRRSTPRDERHLGGVSIAFQDSGSRTAVATSQGNNPRGRHVSASAPVNVPDWSKILWAESVESLREMDDGGYYNNDETEMVPPHEYLAREYARSRNTAAATSVFEGVGRTLKGRDMRRVRDAVWSQTGFDG
ncbi:hypothetical protein IC582_029521 [Cucumis melo]|uniref:Uncharacterized protein LOC103485322 n=1 Tax=Cucumis melo TaxID=3656 RepID=A0A1S3B268_CUCME|nr:uncharacterized protein LOC103485322 [Cucumis melo]